MKFQESRDIDLGAESSDVNAKQTFHWTKGYNAGMLLFLMQLLHPLTPLFQNSLCSIMIKT